MSAGGKARTFGFIALTILVTLLFAFHRLSQGGDVRRHARVTAEVRDLRRLETQLDDFVLRSRFGMLPNYDPLIETESQIELAQARLELDYLRDEDVGSNARAILDRLRGDVDSKRRRLEGFKSENAVLGNLTQFFPTVVERALNSVHEMNDADLLRKEITDLVGCAIRLVAHVSSDAEAEFEARLIALESKTAGGRIEKRVTVLLDYANRLAEQKSVTDGHLAGVLEVRVQDSLRDLETALNEDFAAKDRSASRHRAVLLAFALLISAAAAAVGLRLISTSEELLEANTNLEFRIAERTSELAQRNDDLECEIVERRRVEEELIVKNKELDEFTYVASHDLQEPLRKLVSFSAMLEEDVGEDLNDSAREDLGFITDAAERMQTLVQDVLELSRAGKTAMNKAPVDLGTCVERAVEALAIRVEETGASIDHGTLPEVLGDATVLTQLFQNLIGNALKFTAEGVTPEVKVSAEPSGSDCVIRIADNGIGIDPRHQETIFAPFKRLHGRSDYEGTGIGLSICSKAAHRHGGTIGVESELGEGTTFVVTLPALDPQPA